MPAAAGIAVGIDRLVMLFADVPTIQETLWFPANEVFDIIQKN
jgi:lysyl-tRNA synthetase class II